VFQLRMGADVSITPSVNAETPRSVATTPVPDETRITYFGPDCNDPAFRRRLAQWRHAGFRVQAFAFARPTMTEAEPDCIVLGRVAPQRYAGRLIALLTACLRLVAARHVLRGSRLLIARNLDNLLLACVTRFLVQRRLPIVYEVLDINPSCTEGGLRAALFRRFEKVLLRAINLLVVSSPHFVTEYFEKLLSYSGPWQLFENKVPKFAQWPVGSGLAPTNNRSGAHWRIGWFGYLDDERSWACLKQLAIAFPDTVEIVVRGIPYTNFDAERFLQDVGRLPNVDYGGGFRNPEDLPTLYGRVDLVWAIDTNNLNANSKWLLTNSIYEAGFFGVPILALRGTAVGDYVAARGIGWCVEEPLQNSLVRFIAGLDDVTYRLAVDRLCALARIEFCETDEIGTIWSRVLRRAPRGRAPLAGPARAN
jgi:succinoglycan biosynthesis protein ExoL